MSAYSLLRAAHSYWRWVVLISAIAVLVRTMIGAYRRSDWTDRDERAARIFLSALDLQVVFGVILYFGFSPFWPATYHSFHETMRGEVARFFGIEHETAMLLAFIAVHVGRLRSKRALDGAATHRTMRTALVIFFALVLWAIPWPWRAAGRPLFRSTL
jgi:hypothetical protein